MEESPRKLILVVEDDVHLGKMLCAYLKRSGYDAELAATGHDALDFCDVTCPAAVMADVHLPDLNGLILTSKLRQKFGKAMPIIVLSGDTSMEVIRSLSHVGATHFFNKPLNLDNLRQHLSDLLSGTAVSADCP